MSMLCLSIRKSTHPLMPPPPCGRASQMACRPCPRPSNTPPACAPPPASLGYDLPAGVPARAQPPAEGCGAAPVWPPRSAWPADACCAVWRSAHVVLCPLSCAARWSPTIAGRLTNRSKSAHLSHLQRPTQGQDLAHAGNRLQSHHPLAEVRMLIEPLQQPPLNHSE